MKQSRSELEQVWRYRGVVFMFGPVIPFES
jgi:hypothetical protein